MFLVHHWRIASENTSLWKEFWFPFKEEAQDVETFCHLLVKMEKEAVKVVSGYSSLTWMILMLLEAREGHIQEAYDVEAWKSFFRANDDATIKENYFAEVKLIENSHFSFRWSKLNLPKNWPSAGKTFVCGFYATVTQTRWTRTVLNALLGFYACHDRRCKKMIQLNISKDRMGVGNVWENPPQL
jgi:hypothetical protein